MGTLAALLTPLIAGIAAYIAYQQWKTNDLKVRIDLFDRRLAVYDAAANLMYQAISQGDLTWDQLQEFSRETKDAQFLFKEDVAEYLTKMGDTGEQLIRDNERYRKQAEMMGSFAKVAHIESVLSDIEKSTDWFQAQPKPMKALFRRETRLI